MCPYHSVLEHMTCYYLKFPERFDDRGWARPGFPLFPDAREHLQQGRCDCYHQAGRYFTGPCNEGPSRIAPPLRARASSDRRAGPVPRGSHRTADRLGGKVGVVGNTGLHPKGSSCCDAQTRISGTVRLVQQLGSGRRQASRIIIVVRQAFENCAKEQEWRKTSEGSTR